MNLTARAILACTLLTGLVAPPVASAHEAAAPVGKLLGTVDFPTSTRSAPAQAAFQEGLLYMHLFEYPQAEAAFQKAQALDPEFVMAYWGEAMTYTHPVWNQQDMERGRAALAKLGANPQARAAKAGTARERGFLSAVEIYYSEGTKVERDQRYLEAMSALSAADPADDEARLFHALALLGVTQGDRDIGNFLRAAELSREVYQRNPKHPGAAHYWIHGMDDPQHAAGALEPARTLSKIAPGAGHAQHMTSHIFIALGLWDDVVESNLAAERLNNSISKARGQPEYTCGHYAEWLQYAYFQQGRHREAAAFAAECASESELALKWFQAHPDQAIFSMRTPAAFQGRMVDWVVRLRGVAMIEAPAYAEKLAAMSIPGADADASNPWALFGPAVTAAQAGNATQAGKSAQALKAIAASTGGDKERDKRNFAGIMAAMLDAVIAGQAGNVEQALTAARDAAQRYDALPFDFGPPVPFKPPHELLGDLLLAAARPEEALVEYDAALKAAPLRALSLLGRARALHDLHDPRASAAYQQLRVQWANADHDLAALAEVRQRAEAVAATP